MKWLPLLFILAGCASAERKVQCEAECKNCEEVTLICEQTVDIEVNKTKQGKRNER